MKLKKKMKVFLLLSIVSICSSRNAPQEKDHKFVTGFVVTHDNKNDEERKSREIVEIIPDATTVSSLSSYPIDCTNQKECDAIYSETTPMPTFRPYSQEELNSFLKKYVEHQKNPENPTNKLANIYMDEPVNVLESSREKSKSWQLMHSQTHNHPHDDKTGWVTLEPVPWSASQIQKWEPNRRPPQIPQWDQSEYKPNKWQDKPWDKPTYDYKPTPVYKPTYDYNKPSWSDSWGSGSDIITDGRPSSFPHENNYKQWYKPQDMTEQLPGDGDGRWVLLSSTKGYSLPQRNRSYQRALAVQPQGQQLKSHRSVRLTVLPPEDDENTTTSHGGILEVEKGTQTVDEAQREHAAKMLKLTPTPSAVKRSGSVRVYPIKLQQPKNNAVLAAVGAGMIPATMAMLLPMVLGRKRRSIKENYVSNSPYEHVYFY